MFLSNDLLLELSLLFVKNQVRLQHFECGGVRAPFRFHKIWKLIPSLETFCFSFFFYRNYEIPHTKQKIIHNWYQFIWPYVKRFTSNGKYMYITHQYINFYILWVNYTNTQRAGRIKQRRKRSVMAYICCESGTCYICQD